MTRTLFYGMLASYTQTVPNGREGNANLFSELDKQCRLVAYYLAQPVRPKGLSYT